MLVLLLHITAIIELRPPENVPDERNTPVPLSVEVTLLGKAGPKTPAMPPPVPAPAKPKPKPKPKTESPKAEPKKTPPVTEKSPDVGEIERLIKSRSVKPVSHNVNYQPDRQTAQAVSAAMVMPSGGKASARDNFPVSDVHNPSPEYPEMAVFLGYQGSSVIRIKVSAQGLSTGVEIVRSSGHKILDESAAKALRLWRFTPSKHGTGPMSDSVIISVDYVLYTRSRQ